MPRVVITHEDANMTTLVSSPLAVGRTTITHLHVMALARCLPSQGPEPVGVEVQALQLLEADTSSSVHHTPPVLVEVKGMQAQGRASGGSAGVIVL
jgi:hypothetical protein